MARAALLVCYTVAALLMLPFAVVLALYAPMVAGTQSRPDGPRTILVTLALVVLPLLLLIGPASTWVAWIRERTQPAVSFALIPLVDRLLVVIALSTFVG